MSSKGSSIFRVRKKGKSGARRAVAIGFSVLESRKVAKSSKIIDDNGDCQFEAALEPCTSFSNAMSLHANIVQHTLIKTVEKKRPQMEV
jgi:hypothetical protein